MTSQENEASEDAPIQNLEAVDVMGRRRDAGIDLVVTISGRLEDTEGHRDLVLRKLDFYLAVIQCAEFRAEFPNPTEIRIIFEFAVSPAQPMLEWCNTLAPVVSEHGAALTLNVRP